jgi:hypothetical protein
MTCLKDTYWFLSPRPDADDFTIIHAIVERKIDRLRHPHSVIYNKKTGNIHEVSNKYKDNNIILPFRIWIEMGNVSNIKQYTLNEFTDLLIKTKKWDFYHIHNK